MRQTFLGFRHAFLPHAWRTTRNVCVGGYKPQPDQHSGSWITEKKVLPLKWHLQSVRLSCPLGYEWKIVCPVSQHFHFSFSKFGVLDRWSHTRSCYTWRLNCISIHKALFMGRITRHFTVGVCKTRNRPGTPLDRLENRGAPSPSGGVPGLFLVLQTSFQSEATECYNTKRQNMINKSSDILFSNELESELGLTLGSQEGAMYGEQIHVRIS